MADPPILQVFLILLGAAAISSKPYFDLGASYEDMMRSVGRFLSISISFSIIKMSRSEEEMQNMFSGVRRGVEGLGREAEVPLFMTINHDPNHDANHRNHNYQGAW